MSTAIAKPVRVIHELTATEQFIRAIERAKEIRDAGRARLDADYVERIEDARNRYIATSTPGQIAPAKPVPGNAETAEKEAIPA